MRPLTHILPLDLQSEWTLSPNGPPQQIFILSIIKKRGFPFKLLVTSWYVNLEMVMKQELRNLLQ
jgi:hypothetical protein